MGKVTSTLRGGLQPPLAVPPLGATTVEAEFDWTPACHAPLESEFADVRPDRADIWAGFQAPIVAQQEIANLRAGVGRP